MPIMYALIPALDEAANVERLFADLRDVRTSLAAHDLTLQVVLIDGGSTIRQLQSRFGVGLVERRGFESMVELALKLVYSRMSISEVPMVLDAGRRVGSSKMRVTRTGLGY